MEQTLTRIRTEFIDEQISVIRTTVNLNVTKRTELQIKRKKNDRQQRRAAIGCYRSSLYFATD